MGVEVEGDEHRASRPARTLVIADDLGGAIPKIEDGPWPAFPADLTSIALAVATQARGTVLIFEKMFESRLFFVDKLVGMGARIILCDPHRVVVERAGAALRRAHVEPGHPRRHGDADRRAVRRRARPRSATSSQIDRGYERIDERLRALGASIERVETARGAPAPVACPRT